MLGELFRRIHHLFHRRRFQQELADEMAFHREMSQKSGGVSLGNALLHRENARDAWGFLWLDRLGQDLRYAFRSMRSSPGFTASAVLVLSIGIGATVAVFSAVNNVTMTPLPVRDPDSILRFERRSRDHVASEIAYPVAAFYRDHSRALAAVLAQTSSEASVEGRDEPAHTLFVTSNFFDELGAAPAHGRLLNSQDGRPDAPPAIVLGYGFWTTQFGADPSVVGTTTTLNGKSVTIVGVAAREFTGLGAEAPALWAPIEHHGDIVSGSRILTDFSGGSGRVTMWGRLRPGQTARAAEDELSTLAADLRRQHPDDIWEGERLRSEPGGYPPSLLGATEAFAIIGVFALLILAVACGNLGSLLLARGASRQREIALRTAIGAGTGRLIRQLFTESLALAALGCGGGLVLGAIAFKSLMAWTSAPPWFKATPDWRVVIFAVAMGVVTATMFGLAPALRIARQDTRTKTTRTKCVLIAAQVASSCILLIIGGLLVRAFDRAVSVDPGFEYEHVIVIEPSLDTHGYTPERARVYVRELTARLAGIAGVAHVSFTPTPPLGNSIIVGNSLIDGKLIDMYINQVDPRYLETMRIPLRAGRNLTEGDDNGVVVSESLASKFWPGRDALGQTLKIGSESLPVLGIAGNARTLALGNPEAVEVYRMARTPDFPGMVVVARTSGPSAPVAPVVMAAANGIDPGFKPRVYLLKDQFASRVRDIQQSALAVSVLGLIALAVSCLGVVGLVAYAVAARTKEIGIRRALGAQPAQIMIGIVRQLQTTVLAGLAAGILGAFAFAQLLRRGLYGVSTVDPLAYVGAVALFVIATVIAALWPARRVMRVDPLIALRQD